VSFGGALNHQQPLLIRAGIQRLPLGATVRIATDNDKQGTTFAFLIEGLVG
jgi:hypothetical protein